MPNPTEKSLNALLSTAQRIESMLSEQVKKKDKEGGAKMEKIVGGINEQFVNMTKSLESIDTESKKTNELLQSIIDHNVGTDEKTKALVTDTSKAMEKLGNAWDPLFDAIQDAGSLKEKEIKAFRNVLLTLAFVDYKTGDPLVESDQLKNAAALIGSLKTLAMSVLILGGTMVLFSFMLPQIMKGSLGVGIVLGTVVVALFAMQKVLGLKGDEKDVKEAKGPINSLVTLAKGIALFGLIMVAFSFVVPQIVAGVVPFLVVLATVTLGLWMMDKVLGSEGMVDLSLKDKSPLGSLMRLGKAIAMFALTFVLLSFVLPQVAKGALGFLVVLGSIALGIMMVHLAFKIAGLDFNPMKDSSPLGTMWKLAKSVAMFALTFVLMSFVLPQIAKGALGFLMVIAALTPALWLMHKVLGGSKFRIGKSGQGPMDSLWKLAKSIVVFSLVFIGISYFMKQYATGALAIILTLTVLSPVLALFGLRPVKRGLQNLRLLGINLAIFVGGLYLFATMVQPKLGWEGIAMLGAVIGVMGLVGLLLGIKPIDGWVKAGAMNLVILGVALITFSIGIAIMADPIKKWGWEEIGKFAAIVGVMALVGTVLGIPPIVGFAIAGAAALVILGVALITFSAGLAIYATKVAGKMTMKDVGILGAIIGVMALVGTLIGIPPVIAFVFAGAAALMVLGVALIAITTSLAIFKKSGFDGKKDGKNLKDALLNVMLGMMGRDSMPSGIFGWIKAGMAAMALAGTLLVTSAAMVVASAALLPISIALSIFKATGWTFKDSINLRFTLQSIGDAFASVAEGDNWWRVQLGIWGMRDVGGTLISLAKGIQAMANMTFTEYVWDEETKQLQPKAKIKLTRDDVKAAADNAAYTISALSKPLADFGAMMDNSSSKGSWFTQMGFGKNGIERGIDALGSLGKGLVNMAMGVRDWASMSYWEWDLVYNPETKMKELRPVAKRKITPDEIKEATANISYTISGLVAPLRDFGNMMQDSSDDQGWWSRWTGGKNSIEKGITSLSTLGNGLVKMAQGVRDWATMSYWEYDLVYNPETKMNELKPVKKRKLTDPEIRGAIDNISYMISALVEPLRGFGAMMQGADDDRGFWARFKGGKNGIEKGIDSLGTLAKNIQDMGRAVRMFAGMQFIEWTVQKDPKTKLNKLVPGKVVKLSEQDIKKAMENIGQIIGISAQVVIDFNDKINKAGIGGFLGVTGIMIDMGVMNKKLLEIVKAVQGSKYIRDGKSQGIIMNNWKLFWLKYFAPFRDIRNIISAKLAAPIVMKVLLPVTAVTLKAYELMLPVFGPDGHSNKVARNWQIFLNKIWSPMTPARLMGLAVYNKGMHIYNKNLLNLTKIWFKGFGRKIMGARWAGFTKTMVVLAKIHRPFERFVSSFERLAIAMGTFSNNFKLMDAEGIRAFNSWTQSLLQVVEVGKAQGSTFTNFLDAAGSVVNSGFEYAKETIGSGGKDPNTIDEAEKKSLIEKTNEGQDPGIKQLASAIDSLKAEIAGLKSAMGGTMQVEVTNHKLNVNIED